MAEVSINELMDQRYTERMGLLLAQSEKRCIAAEVTIEYYQQKVAELEAEITRLDTPVPDEELQKDNDTVLDDKDSDT